MSAVSRFIEDYYDAEFKFVKEFSWRDLNLKPFIKKQRREFYNGDKFIKTTDYEKQCISLVLVNVGGYLLFRVVNQNKRVKDYVDSSVIAIIVHYERFMYSESNLVIVRENPYLTYNIYLQTLKQMLLNKVYKYVDNIKLYDIKKLINLIDKFPKD